MPESSSIAALETRAVLKSRAPLGWFLQKRVCWIPTWQSWCLGLLAVALLGTASFRGLYRFLAIHDPVLEGPCVMEGWMGESELKVGLAEFRRHPYSALIVVGGPIESESSLASYGTYARLGAARLRRLGADPQKVQIVDAPWVPKDRTYTGAKTVRKWLVEKNLSMDKVNLVSVGAHARRSRLLYEKAFGPPTRVGIFAVPDDGYDTARWWESSAGFRTVVSEAIAYGYARCFFWEDGE